MTGLRFLTAGFAIAACSGFAAWSYAQGPARPPQGGFDPAAIFQRLDTNGDGSLTMAEVPQNERRFAERLFEMGGKPATGSLTRAEFMEIAERHRNGAPPPRGSNNPPRQGAGQPPEERENANDAQLPPVLQSFDANHDQRLTRTELTRFVRQFEQLDTNGDGALDVAELSVPAAETSGAGRDDASAGSGTTRPGPAAGGAPRGRTGGTGGTSRSGSGSGSTRANSGTRPEGAANVAGVWRGWVVDGNGERPNSGRLQMELRIEGRQMSARELGNANPANEGLGTGTFQMTGTGNSGNLDATGTSGRHDGVDYLGIFEIEGDTLRWCVGNNGRPRPTEFASGRGNYLMVLRREARQE